MDYAIIKLGNKQHKVRDGEYLVVDRLPTDEGKSFEPVVLLGETKVTATILAHERGPKIRIGKYRKRTGYKRHNGFRAATSRVQITLGAGTKRPAAAKPAATTPKAEAAVVEAPAEPKAVATPKQAAATVPAGYDDLTIADLKTAIDGWSTAELEAALAHEQANAARKGAIAALESALAKESD